MHFNFVMPGFVWSASGSHRVIFEYANHLNRRGHRITLTFPETLPNGLRTTTTLVAQLRQLRTRLKRRLSRPIPPWFRLDEEIEILSVPSPRAEHVINADVVIATSWAIAEWVSHYPASHGVPLYVVHHDEVAGGYPVERVRATLFSNMPIIAVSQATHDALVRLAVPRVTYIPNGIDQAVYRPEYPIEGRDKIVAMAYLPRAVKDPETGLTALSMVKNLIPEMRAILFGVAKPPARLPHWAQFYRNASTATIVRSVYSVARVFLCSSRIEGFGLPGAEAMACGSAVVSTDCGGVRDYITHGVTGLLSPVGDARALADNVATLLSDEQYRVQLAHQGVERVRTLSWTKSAEKFELVASEASAPKRGI